MKKIPYRQVLNADSGQVVVECARWCDGFASKARGFTFRRSLAPGEGLVLVDSSDSRINSGITMLFCFLDLGVVWVNEEGEVVDTTVARPWRPSYLPQAPACFAIESDPGLVERVRIGDHLKFVELPASTEEGTGTAPGSSPKI